MASERTPVKLGNALAALIDHRGRTPLKLGGEFTSAGIPVISAKNIENGRLVLGDARYVPREMWHRWMPEKLKPGDVLLTSEAPLGEAAYLDTEASYCLGQRLFALRADPAILCSRFLYYLLRSAPIQQRLQARATGTTAQGIRQAELVKVELDLPSLTEQCTIANILGALDDKIELNRRTNVTLEAMARTLFQSWFIDFEPVRAKAAGRQPTGMDAATAALFPDAFEDSSLGEIPQGWTVDALSDVIQLNPSRSLARGIEAPYVEMSNLPTRSARVVQWESRSFSSGMRFVNGDVLVARITPCLENGKTGYVDFLQENQVGWGSTEFIVLHSKATLPPEYSYFVARSDAFRSFAIQNMTGTSGRQRVPTTAFDSYLMVVPSKAIAYSFGSIAHQVMTAMKQRDDESNILAAMRDLLLPTLLSGELRIDAEPFAGQIHDQYD